MSQAQHLQRMSLTEFEEMPRDERFTYELIDGVVMMAPSPSYEHQKIGSNCIYSLRDKIVEKHMQCDIIYELDLKINGDVYRPDVLVFCGDKQEVPLIVIEIVSPSSTRRDMLLKPSKYELASIAEYWIIDPASKVVIVHDYINGVCQICTQNDIITSAALSISLPVAELFN